MSEVNKHFGLLDNSKICFDFQVCSGSVIDKLPDKVTFWIVCGWTKHLIS